LKEADNKVELPIGAKTGSLAGVAEMMNAGLKGYTEEKGTVNMLQTGTSRANIRRQWSMANHNNF
jgi:hypothetical protein